MMTMALFENLREYFHGGGPVMLPLVLVSVWMWALIMRKMRQFGLLLKTERHIPLEQLQSCGGDIQAADWQREIAVVFVQTRSGIRDLDRALLDSVLSRHISTGERHIGTILVLAAIAPLLGLMGTIGGMITTFDAIAFFGTGNARALSAGISAALITTQAGLIVSVPGLLLGNFLQQRAGQLENRMKHFCLELFRELEPHAHRDMAAGCVREAGS